MDERTDAIIASDDVFAAPGADPRHGSYERGYMAGAASDYAAAFHDPGSYGDRVAALFRQPSRWAMVDAAGLTV